MRAFPNVRNIATQIMVRRKRGVGSFVAGFLLALVWQLYKHVGGPAFVIRTYRGTRFLLDPRSIMSSRFVYEGRPDEPFIQILGAFSGGQAAFVDVGANVGMYTTLLSNNFHRGWMFEPNPIAAEAVRCNLALNAASERFSLLQMAVGEAKGSVRFPYLDTADPAAQVIAAGSSDDSARSFEVPITTLDHVLPPDLEYAVKIDTEGFDAKVVSGMSGLLKSGKILVCLFECHTDETLVEVISLVAPHGYAVMDGAREIFAPVADRNRDLFVVCRRLLEPYLRAVADTNAP